MSLIATIKRRWARALVGLVIVVAVLAVGGPYVYIHFIEGKAPAPLALSSGSAATASGTTASCASGGAAPAVDGAWKAACGSTAGYRVKETLLGQSTTAVGRTTAITGTMTITGSTVDAASFSVDMTQVSSDRSQRDGQFQGRIMDTAQFPTATFRLTSPIALGSLPAPGVPVSAKATGELMLHGTKRSVTFDVKAQRSGSTIQVNGSIPITFADWGINNPSAGPAITGDTGTLEFLLVFAKA
ncbi:MAG: YceI family protein [Acidimicrobiales bacterium]|nr:YceI family protein [Acidimicrobiales bacterium]